MTSDRPKTSPRKDSAQKASEADPSASKGERIAKRLARVGVASRRDAEAIIAAGRVTVNGKVLTTPALNVGPSDRIEVDGKPLPEVERTRLFLFHKPAGLVTTNRDPQGRQTVFDVLPPGLPRLITIGRLDINTEGLLVLTNDGGLARTLELPSTGWLRRYRVRVHGKVDATALEGLKEGIAVDGVFYGAIEATLDREQGSNAWLTVGLREGKNREVKNVLGALGLDVTRLIRLSYGPFQLGTLGEGEVQEIKGRMLRDQLGDRLIAEAGANFEAPIAKPFSNKPVRGERKTPAGDKGEARPPRGDEPRERIGGEGFVKNRKRDREEHREEMRGRLQTRPGGRRDDDERREGSARHSRGAHVWMAPGARPQGKRKAEMAEEQAAEKPRSRTRPAPSGKERARPAGEAGSRDRFARSGKPRTERPFGKDKPDEGGEGRGRSFAKRAPGAFRKDGDKPTGRSRPEGGERERFPKGDKPFSARPHGKGKPRPDGDRPRSAEPHGDRKPGGTRPDARPGAKPAGKFGAKPAGKPFGKPGAKPFGKPGGKFAGKPAAAGKGRPAGARPGKPAKGR
ncbi:pseudouridine synthase [Nitratireductor soli]|uniref:pseudouridine synthase n=1 Tax=Nitratireductor soli TaxID=1670619 RepID=UPI00069E4BBA|nr:pseudouridine synthase [Nitratireductor soli]